MILGASILFVNSSSEILLFQRDNKPDIPFPNCWDLLGGHIEPGETPLQAIVREMKEEIEVELKDPPLFRVYQFPDRVENSFWQPWDLRIDRIRLHEGQRLMWFSEDEIQQTPDDQIAFGFKVILLDFFRQKPFRKI